jgi:metal-dependent hydrolase (beta-lactamase superfamily II)
MLEARGPVTIAPWVMNRCEVPRIEPFEKVEVFRTIKDGQYCQDKIPDDQALSINMDGKGLAVITGCTHTGQKAVCRLQEALDERCRPLTVGDTIQI